MKKSILLILIIFQSCYTVQKAKRQVIKADMNYPEMFTNYVVKAYPVKDSVVEKIKVVKGKDIIKYDTIKEIDCDSVISDTITNNKVLIRFKTLYRTDTIKTIKEVFRENTAKINSLELKIDRVDKENKELKEKVKSAKKYKSYFFIIIVLIGLGVILKFRII